MISFEFRLASDDPSLIRFTMADIMLVAFVTLLTLKIAALINHRKITGGETVSVSTWGLPYSVGDVATSRGVTGAFLILLPASMIIAICIGNRGLQGHSTTTLERRMVNVRRPGPVGALTQLTLFNATEVRLRCARADGDELKFGAVYDGKCFFESPEFKPKFVFVKSLSLTYENIRYRVGQCNSLVASPNLPITVFDCQDSGFSCFGLLPPNFPPIQYETCEGVVYRNSSAYYCPAKGFNPSITETEQEADCRKMGVVRQDVGRWVDLYNILTADFLDSIFGAAYAAESQEMVDMPVEKKLIVTNISSWLISSLWQPLVVVGLIVWYCSLFCSGAQTVATDELALTQRLTASMNPTDGR